MKQLREALESLGFKPSAPEFKRPAKKDDLEGEDTYDEHCRKESRQDRYV